jgi:hypothetical protein
MLGSTGCLPLPCTCICAPWREGWDAGVEALYPVGPCGKAILACSPHLPPHPATRVQEYFDAGSTFGLKDMLTIKGEKRVINFYHSARLDGLMQRTELMGTKIIETFCNRDDFLAYRSGTYVQQEPEPEAPEEDADECALRCLLQLCVCCE